MTQTNPECYHLSASCIKSFKACPTRFRLAYREGIRRKDDTDALRIGTNWHALHEVYHNAIEGYSHPDFTDADREAWDFPHDYAMNAVMDHLNEAYSQRSPTKTPDEWDLERQQLLTGFIGYLWYFQADTIEYLHQEYAFDLQVTEPKSGMPLPFDKVKRVGKIDHIVMWNGVVGPIERKSTTRGIGDSDDYWIDKQKDTQVSMYALAFRDGIRHKWLPEELMAKVGKATRAGNTIYDVWRRPLTKPKKLTQGDTKTFLEDGKYCDTDFEITVQDDGKVFVDHVEAEVHLGAEKKQTKKQKEDGVTPDRPFAIRETVDMYAARLLADIVEEPSKYYVRKEITRTDRDLDRFQVELFNIYQSQKMMNDAGVWFENEQQCRATFPCEFIPICYGQGSDAVCDGKTTPDGFKRIFVDLNIDLEGAE